MTAAVAELVVLHPGSMGAAIGAQLVSAGSVVGWVEGGRSEATRARARDAGLSDAGSLAEALAGAEVVLSVCPPHAAREVAGQVAASRFAGCFADLNAISPDTMAEVGGLFEGTGVSVIDGSLIGSPPRSDRDVRLYLAGDREQVDRLLALFEGTRVRASELAGGVGRASALKMAYALHRKGALALAAAAQAIAEEHDVLDALDREWELPGGVSPAAGLAKSAASAWRWTGEMREMALTCRAAGLPPSLPEAAEELYERWAELRDRLDVPRAELLAELRDSGEPPG